MIKKLDLNNIPASFKQVVTFPMGEERTGSIELEYKWPSRKAHADLLDQLREMMTADTAAEIKHIQDTAIKGDPIPEIKHADIVARESACHVQYILSTVIGWDLDMTFSKEAVEQLVDEVPTAAAEVISAYRAAAEGRY